MRIILIVAFLASAGHVCCLIPWLSEGYSMAFPQLYTQRFSKEKSYPPLIRRLFNTCSGAYAQSYAHLLKKRAGDALQQQQAVAVYLACE
jgi:hypothetical protein